MKIFYIDREITDDLATQVHQFVNELAQQEDTSEEIKFVYNSPGGSVQAGLAIYDLIASITNPTRTEICGLCASAATYPALAADVVTASKNSTFMIHPVTGGIYGNIQELKQDLEWMSECEGRVQAIYAAKTGLSIEEVTAMMDATTYMDAQQMLDYGFVDEVPGLEKTPKEEPETEETTEETEEPKDEEETTEEQTEEEEKEEETEEEPEKGGLVNRILSMAGLKAKGEVFHRPAEDEQDYQAEIKNLKDEVASKDMEIRNAAAVVDKRETEFENYRKEQLAEIEELKASVQNAVETLEDRVKTEVMNRIASLGYDVNDLPSNQEPKNTAPVQMSEAEQLFKEFGLR